MKAISLGYHDVSDCVSRRDGASLYRLGRKNFRNHILSVRQVVPAVHNIDRFCTWRQEDRVFLTFDDGFVSGYEYVADVLDERQWRGHFLITTDWIGQPGFLDAPQIRELRGRGHVIGSHSCSHPARMSRLDWPQLVHEWSESRLTLSDIAGEEIRVASVPDGYYSPRVGRAAAAAGIEVLFTSEPTNAVSVIEGCLILGRYFVRKNTPPETSGAIASGALWPRWRQKALWEGKRVLKWMMGSSYLAVRNTLISRVSI